MKIIFNPKEREFELFIHQTGLFSSGLEVMVNRDWLSFDTTVLLHAKQLTQIPNNTRCSDRALFDRCKGTYLLGAVNATMGCTPR